MPEDVIGVASTTEEFSNSGNIASGDAAIISSETLTDGDTFEVVKASLHLVDGQPVPSGVNLIIATLDGAGGATQQATVLSGDGSNTFSGNEGSPLASHTNNSGADQVVATFADNGNFGTGAGSGQNVQASVEQGIA